MEIKVRAVGDTEEKSPEFFDIFLVNRNKSWIPKINKLKKLRKKENEKKDIIKFNKFKIFTRSFNSEDLSWWKQFGITLKTLKFYNVHAVSKYQQQYNFNKFRTVYKYDAKDPCYAFKVNNNFKLYRPLTEHYFNKWKSNVKKDDIFGLKNIPYYGKNLFITSGLKDLMCVSEMGYESIAPQSETTPFYPRSPYAVEK